MKFGCRTSGDRLALKNPIAGSHPYLKRCLTWEVRLVLFKAKQVPSFIKPETAHTHFDDLIIIEQNPNRV